MLNDKPVDFTVEGVTEFLGGVDTYADVARTTFRNESVTTSQQPEQESGPKPNFGIRWDGGMEGICPVITKLRTMLMDRPVDHRSAPFGCVIVIALIPVILFFLYLAWVLYELEPIIGMIFFAVPAWLFLAPLWGIWKSISIPDFRSNDRYIGRHVVSYGDELNFLGEHIHYVSSFDYVQGWDDLEDLESCFMDDLNVALELIEPAKEQLKNLRAQLAELGPEPDEESEPWDTWEAEDWDAWEASEEFSQLEALNSKIEEGEEALAEAVWMCANPKEAFEKCKKEWDSFTELMDR